VLRLPAYDPSGGVPAAVMESARIVGDESSGCVWLLSKGEQRLAALWYPGTTARFNPLRVFNPDGSLRWTEGQQFDVGGGLSPVIGDLPPACRIGSEAWMVAL
jgi:hypothetical protein